MVTLYYYGCDMLNGQFYVFATVWNRVIDYANNNTFICQPNGLHVCNIRVPSTILGHKSAAIVCCMIPFCACRGLILPNRTDATQVYDHHAELTPPSLHTALIIEVAGGDSDHRYSGVGVGVASVGVRRSFHSLQLSSSTTP